ncbi:MAG: hypothetical protein ORN28_12145, partial [Rhodoferax sp.]|nr:hypothetical protein [Rhodoferax sp.]
MTTSTFTNTRGNDNQFWMHPWEHMPSAGEANRTIIERGDGIYVYDNHGNRLIDGPGGMWCKQIGYARQEMADAIAKQVMQ